MILLDPDLTPPQERRPVRGGSGDSGPGPVAFNPKRTSSTAPAPIDRNSRVPSARTLGRFLAEAREAVRLRGQVSVLLTTDRNIRRLNRQFRGKDKATDVLSFPAHDAMKAE